LGGGGYESKPYYGAAKSARPQQNGLAVAKLLNALESVGASIGPYDTLIAGSAMNRGATLVTANAPQFSRVRSLRWEDWEKTIPPKQCWS